MSSLRVRLYTRSSLGIKRVMGEAHIHLRALADAGVLSLKDSWPLSGVVGQVEMKLSYLENQGSGKQLNRHSRFSLGGRPPLEVTAKPLQ
jgi:hypothetical protein